MRTRLPWALIALSQDKKTRWSETRVLHLTFTTHSPALWNHPPICKAIPERLSDENQCQLILCPYVQHLLVTQTLLFEGICWLLDVWVPGHFIDCCFWPGKGNLSGGWAGAGEVINSVIPRGNWRGEHTGSTSKQYLPNGATQGASFWRQLLLRKRFPD